MKIKDKTDLVHSFPGIYGTSEQTLMEDYIMSKFLPILLVLHLLYL